MSVAVRLLDEVFYLLVGRERNAPWPLEVMKIQLCQGSQCLLFLLFKHKLSLIGQFNTKQIFDKCMFPCTPPILNADLVRNKGLMNFLLVCNERTKLVYICIIS